MGWVYLEQYGDEGILYNNYAGNIILSRGDLAYSHAWDFIFNVNGYQKLSFVTHPEFCCVDLVAAEDDFPLQEWVMVSFTHQSSTGRLYQNGQLVDTNESMRAGNYYNEIPMLLGANWYSDQGDHKHRWDGYMDDIVIYDRVLSQEEIADIYANKGHPTAGLSYHWECNEGTGTTIGDSVGGNDGTLIGTSWSGEHRPNDPCATPSVTPTPSVPPTPTVTPPPSATPTPTPSATQTPTPSTTPTTTPSATPTPMPSTTPTTTPSATPTLTPSATPTTTPSATATPEDYDVDGDRLPDVWEMQYFGDLDQNGIMDSDGDWYPNYYEYVGGGEPNNFSSTPSASFTVDTEGIGGYSSIKSALTAAADDDIILVKAGIYEEHDIRFRGKRVLLLAEDGPESVVVDCQSSWPGFFFSYSEDELSILTGFEIINGSSTTSDGGGIFISDCSPTITHCIIRDNSGWRGGGIFCVCSLSSIVNCVITGNNAGATQSGGGRDIRG